MFEGHTPGETVRCPIDGCGFAGTVGQVAAHAAEASDGDGAHDRLARRVERMRSGPAAPDAADRDPEGEGTPVDEFVRLFAAVHGPNAGYEADDGDGRAWLFPFEDG
ncbi:MAG: hypothetical protein ABEH40_09010 [Haloferacaceae archaeon]